MKKKISAGTLTRTAVLGLALTNQLLSAAGKPLLPIDNAQLEQMISTGFTVGAALAAWWKNNSFTQAALAGDEGLKRFAAVVRTYFDHKGMHVQFNVIDKETLLEAQRHPEEHKDLVVRVAGYSAQFTVLAKEVQDDIISRTEQSF